MWGLHFWHSFLLRETHFGMQPAIWLIKCRAKKLQVRFFRFSHFLPIKGCFLASFFGNAFVKTRRGGDATQQVQKMATFLAKMCGKPRWVDAIFTSHNFSFFAAIQLIFLRTILWGGKRCVLCAFFVWHYMRGRKKENELLLVSQNNGPGITFEVGGKTSRTYIRIPQKKCPPHFFPSKKNPIGVIASGKRNFRFLSPKKYGKTWDGLSV